MKSGFAVFVGRSNVGKSTLLNTVVGSKVAITTPKAQTTRHAIHGVFTDDERGQIVFVDTPGILQKNDQLTKKLLQVLKQSLQDIDVVLYTVDATREIGSEEKSIMRIAKEAQGKKILVINKIDSKYTKYIDFYRDLSDGFDATVEVSALRGKNTNELIETIFELLPEGEPFYPKGQLTNLTNEELIAELVREKLFLRLQEEIPYGIHTVVDEIEQRETGVLYIRARILTNQERHKKFIIGLGGRGIKEIGQAARKDLETITNGKVYLELQVEVDERWVEHLI
ncbi:MAG: GTPase Era [bacterium]|nr:GTPase Era [bacterium]